MKKLSVFGAGLLVAAAASAALLGAGTAAAAPDVTGDTYSDATSAIDDDGGKPVIATRVGDKLEQGDCIVTTVSDASFLRIDTSDESEVLLSLNCAGGYATNKNPGPSAASPAAISAKAAEKKAAAEEEKPLEETSTPDA